MKFKSFLRPGCTQLSCFIFIGLSASLLFAQNKTLDRDLEPIVIMGSAFPEFQGAPISNLFAYAYRASTQSWEQIPFQIDERDANGSYFNPNGDETIGLDGNDEFMFMAKDAGDRNVFSWINDVVSGAFVRYEIEITDPLNPSKIAWVYLYRSNTLRLDPGLTDYVDYFKSQTSQVAEDTVRSKFYEIAHNRSGFPNDLIVPVSAGGSGVDILDRMKFRAKASLVISVSLDEDDIQFSSSNKDSIRAKDGMIRVIRELEATLKINLPFPFPDQEAGFSTPPAYYYPYSSSFIFQIPEISTGSVTEGRMSFDLNPDASGMDFMSANNPAPGFIVNGFDDSPDLTVDNVLPDSNWIFYGGDQATIVNQFPLSLSVGGKRELYYKDNSSNNSSDTGDKKSYGDVGIKITDGISTPFTLSYKGYYLDSKRSSDVAKQIVQFEKNPMKVTTTPQDIGTVPVELVAFTATVEHNDVHLRWITATETNNFGFDIESRDEGAEGWQKIAFVKGKGTTTQPAHYEFLHHNQQPGAYEYRLKQIDANGSFEYSESIVAVVGVPETFALLQNFPNPFNPTTSIQYQIPGSSRGENKDNRTVLTIYNLLGQEIRVLVDKAEPPGFYSVTWNGRDGFGQVVPAGVYIYRLQSGQFVDTKKMVLVK